MAETAPLDVEAEDEVEVLPVVDPELADVPLLEEFAPVEFVLVEEFAPVVVPLVLVVEVLLDCGFFSLATSALRFSLEDSSINPKRSVVPLGSLSLGTTRLKRARPRGLFDSLSVTPP